MTISGRIGMVLMGLFLFLAVAGPSLAPQDPMRLDLSATFEAPSWSHPMGTDENGADVLSAVLTGARVGFGISLLTVLCGLLVGGLLGAIAGTFGGLADLLLMRLVDVVFSFPGLLLNLFVLSLVKSPTVGHLIFALVITSWAGFARVARGQALEIRHREFVVAARALGASPARILFFHIVPNILPPLVVQASFSFAAYLLVEAGLSFLGLAPTLVSWGQLIAQGSRYLLVAPHLAIFPGLCLGLCVLGANLLGDHVRDAWDQRANPAR